MLAAWGFTLEGKKVLLHLMAGSKEDNETVSAFFQDMRSRGLGDPLLIASDGAPGIIKAIEICFPRSARQRCLAHRMRNLAAKVPEDLWPEFKARAQAAYQAPSRAIARDLAEGVVRDWERELPSAVACFLDDFEACIAHLRMPVNHRRAIRTTNLLERLFGGGAPALEDHPQRLRRKGGTEAHVRCHEPRRRAMESSQGHRLRAAPDGRRQEGTRSGIPSPAGTTRTGLDGGNPGENSQQNPDLTDRYASRIHVYAGRQQYGDVS